MAIIRRLQQDIAKAAAALVKTHEERIKAIEAVRAASAELHRRVGELEADAAVATEHFFRMQVLARVLGEKGKADASFVTAETGDEDVHAFVERELVTRIGDAGRRLHTGRSRNEQVAVDLRLYLRRRIPLLQAKLRATIAAFVDQADAAGEALMPSYTHMRRAMPVLVSHFLLSHAAALRRPSPGLPPCWVASLAWD